jgi:hypothetical protein
MYIPVCEDKVPTQERFSSYAFKKHGLTHVMTLSGTHTQCHRDSRANGVLFPTLGSPAGPGPPSSPPEQSCPAAWLPGEHAVPLLHLPPTSAQLSANTHPSVSPEGGQSQGTEKGLWKAPQMLKYSTCWGTDMVLASVKPPGCVFLQPQATSSPLHLWQLSHNEGGDRGRQHHSAMSTYQCYRQMQVKIRGQWWSHILNWVSLTHQTSSTLDQDILSV